MIYRRKLKSSLQKDLNSGMSPEFGLKKRGNGDFSISFFFQFTHNLALAQARERKCEGRRHYRVGFDVSFSTSKICIPPPPFENCSIIRLGDTKNKILISKLHVKFPALIILFLAV